MADSLVLHNRHTGERLELRRVVRDGQTCLSLQGSLPPHRQGPPRHIHFAELEEGRVISGTLSAEVEGQVVSIPAGGSATFPAGAAHRWWNDGDQVLVAHGIVRPVVDLDVYLSAVFEVLNSGPVDRPPLFYMAHVAWRHRRTQCVLFMPRAFQTFVLPLIVFVGTLLGRYRGTDWPGSPFRCVPAPIVEEKQTEAAAPLPT
jgi:quercetin dioxygenase-like cupin family protein